MIRIGIFGQSPLERASMRRAVGRDDQVCVVSEGPTASATRLACAGTPDLLVMSHSSVDEALHTLEELNELAVTPRRVVLVDGVTEPGARRMLSRGADGILHSGDCVENLLWAVRAAVAGSVALGPEVAHPLVARYLEPGEAADDMDAAREQLNGLSPRCREILGLLGEGLSNPAIAGKLSISTHTVKDHIRTIYESTGAENRVQAARIFWQAQSRERLVPQS